MLAVFYSYFIIRLILVIVKSLQWYIFHLIKHLSGRYSLTNGCWVWGRFEWMQNIQKWSNKYSILKNKVIQMKQNQCLMFDELNLLSNHYWMKLSYLFDLWNQNCDQRVTWMLTDGHKRKCTVALLMVVQCYDKYGNKMLDNIMDERWNMGPLFLPCCWKVTNLWVIIALWK